MLGSKEDDGQTSAHKDFRHRRGDLESGNNISRMSPRKRFRDVVKGVIQDGRREQMKKKLLDGVKTGNLEKFRKSQDEVSYGQ